MAKQASKSPSLEELIQRVNKDFAEDIIHTGINKYDYSRIPFTSPNMNYCSYGGIPVGMLTEFYGEEHGGKTSSALDIVANYQHTENARSVLYVDAENTLDYQWAKKLGVDVDNIILLQPKAQSAEDIFQIVCEAVETGEVGLWIIDSLGVLLSSQEWDKTIEEKSYGGISKPLTNFSKRIVPLLKANQCTGIGINQVREVIGSQFPLQTTPGGRAWKHCCAVRMQFQKGKYFDANGNELSRGAENPVGNIVLMSMTKNKTCPPDRRIGHYRLNYSKGIDFVADLTEMAIFYGLINKKGSWFDITDPETGEVISEKIHGQGELLRLLDTDDAVFQYVENFVNEKIK